MTKKTIAIIGACVILLAGGIGLWVWLAPKRSEQLKIYNWVEYLDTSIISEFEAWYKENTGKTVKVIHDATAGSSEIMQTKIEQGVDYDLIVPTDYTVGNMIAKGLLKQLDLTKIPNWENLDTDFAEATGYKDYAVPYMVSTNGIMYDASKISISDSDKNWGVLFNGSNSGKLTMKNVPRDSLTAGLLYFHRDALMNKKGTDAYLPFLESIIDFTIPNALEDAKSVLISQKPGVVEYEEDTGREAMITGQGNVEIGLYWGVDASLSMAENKNIEYFVPIEGSNLWFDSFAIPKTAVNIDAAHAFINFILQPDIAVRNMEVAGGDCPVIEAEEEMISIMLDEEDRESDYFILFDKDKNGEIDAEEARWRQMFVDCVITPDTVKERCLTMKPLDNMADLDNAFGEVRFGA
jgi:spermidine/putrescine transport system substrate-binding protein